MLSIIISSSWKRISGNDASWPLKVTRFKKLLLVLSGRL